MIFSDFSNSANPNEFKTLSQDALDPSPATEHVRGPSQTAPMSKHDPKRSTLFTAPNDSIPGNILLQQFPPSFQAPSLDHLQRTVQIVTYGVLAALALTWYSVIRHTTWLSFVVLSSLYGGLGTFAFFALGYTHNQFKVHANAARLDLHRQRGEAFSPPTPESSEWLNAILKIVFPLIDPSMFIAISDMIEDVSLWGSRKTLLAVLTNDRSCNRLCQNS